MMFHAHLEYGEKAYYYWNWPESRISEELVLPFINGQVVLLKVSGKEKLFNMKNATFLKIYRTEEAIKSTETQSASEIIKSDPFQTNDCTGEFLSKVKVKNAGHALTSLLQKAFQPPLPQVFVIMKFGDPVMDDAYRSVMRTVIKKAGLDCIRIDEVQDAGKISDQILEKIAESKYVIADLTGARPNCYYEAGFAHALGKEIILCIKDGEDAHFDLQGHRFIKWKTETDFKKKLRDRIKVLEQKDGKSA